MSENINDTRPDITGEFTSQGRSVEQLRLAAQVQDKIKKNRSLLVELKQQTDSLTKKDIASWRRAHQAALDIENPNRMALYDVYSDTVLDMHLEGCFGQSIVDGLIGLDGDGFNSLMHVFSHIDHDHEEVWDNVETFVTQVTAKSKREVTTVTGADLSIGKK